MTTQTPAPAHLLEVIEDNNLVLLNDNNPTRLQPPNQNKSIIDLTIASPQLATLIDWHITTETLGSDHFLIIFKIQSDTNTNINCKTTFKKLNINKTDWPRFKTLCDSRLMNINNYSEYIQTVDQIVRSCTTDSETRPNRRGKPWWNKNCTESINNRKAALDEYQKKPTLKNFVKYKELDAIAKRTILYAKRTSWRNFCSSLNSKTPIKTLWNSINKIKGIYKPNNPPLYDGEWCEEILRKVTPDYVPYYGRMRGTMTSTCDILDNPITHNELQTSLKNSNNSSPGLDNVHYKTLSELPTGSKNILLKFYNDIFNSHNIPEEWKQYMILPILKPNKNPYEAKSYRPISLSSCVLKTFERILKNRLLTWMELNHKFPKTQFGFRNRYSTYDSLAALVMDINLAFTNRQSVTALFLDIEAAYDNVLINILELKMEKMGLPHKFTELIIELISFRKIFLNVNGNLRGPRVAHIGLPQGSILSPILYVIYTHDLEHIFTDSVKILQYADDICIYTSGYNIDLLHADLNDVIMKVSKWMTEHNLKISPSKSNLCTFSKKKYTPPATRMCHNMEIPCVTSIKFLGLYFDQKLSFNMHINNMIKKAEKNSNILRAVCHIHWGSDIKTSLLIYRSYIRSVLDYGSIFYGQASRTILKKVDIVHNKCLRLSLGLLRSTPIDVIYAECCEKPLEMRRRILSEKFILRQYEKGTKLYDIIHNISILTLTEQYWTQKKSPPVVDAYLNTKEITKIINKTEINPVLKLTNFLQSKHTIRTLNLNNYNETPTHLRNRIFQEDLRAKWPNYVDIYTDGSKKNDRVGAGIYIPSIEMSQSYRLPAEATIFTAELFAILKSLETIFTLNFNKYLIITDCNSAIKCIENIYKSKKPNYLIVKIINNIHKLYDKNIDVRIGWIKGHCNIENNETVDLLAKQGLELENVEDVKVPATDLFYILGKQLNDEYRTQYQINTTGKTYKNVILIPPARPWYNKHELDKTFSTMIGRLRSGHCLLPFYQHRMKMIDSPDCDTCGTLGNIEHFVLNCNRHKPIIDALMAKIYKINIIPKPIHIDQLIYSEDLKILKLIYTHFKSINKRI